MVDSDCDDGTCNVNTNKCQCALNDVDYYGSDLKKFTNVATWEECGMSMNRCFFIHNASTLLQWLPFENRQSPVYVVNMHFSRKPVRQ